MDARSIVEEFYARMSAHDAEGTLDLIDEDVDWWIAGGFPFSGQRTKLEISNLIPMLFGMFPDFKYQLQSTICEGNRVAAVAESMATTPGGTTYHNYYHYLFEVAGGRITVCREYYDTMLTNQVMFGGAFGGSAPGA